jgi:hypothetical protein
MLRSSRTEGWIYTAVLAVAQALWFPIPATAQTPGQNAVCTSSSGCSTTTGTSAFIDASVLFQNDICTTIYFILNGTNGSYSPGAVVDARGINGTAALTCPANATPWLKGGTYLNKPSTILLPAGTILIRTPWALPASTHLFGQGDNPSSGTVIQACTSTTCGSSFSGSSLIQFGNTSCSSSGCLSISIEKLILDGKGQGISGIVNQYSSASYVDHVSLYQILGTGLSLLGGASNSGPFTNINFDTGGYSGVKGTVCVSINGLSNTRGIRGLSCTSRTYDASAAVLLDSSSNLIKGVTIVGFYDGILVGENAPAQSNVLVNVIGDTSCVICGTTPIRAIHISSIKTGGTNNVQDLSILGVANDVSGTYTIWDDLTGAQITDPFVELYALGKPANNGYARFTTSPSYPAWEVGAAAPSTSGTCTKGSMYSCTGSSMKCTGGGKTAALWGCPTGSGWVGIE